MSRRHIHRKQQRKGMYLNPDFEDIQDTLKGTHMAKLPTSMKTESKSLGYGNYHTGGTAGHESHVHRGDKVIFEHGGHKLYAGNGRGVDEYSSNWDLIIDLANNIWKTPGEGVIKQRSAKRFDALKKYTSGPQKMTAELLQLDWPDMGVIPAGLDFWIRLWDMLPERTVMMCMGGHGRTGTCMVALMIAAGETYYSALETVRKEHCIRAVETVTQTKYLHGLYVEGVKRLIAEAEKQDDPEQIKALTEELVYAEAHVPNTQCDYGTKAEKPKEAVGMGSGPFVSGGNQQYETGDRLKYVGGLLYEQVCVDPTCKFLNCTEAEHQGWIEYDAEGVKLGK